MSNRHSDDLCEFFFSAEPEMVAYETIELRHPLISTTNVLLRSQDYGNAAWTKTGTTIGTTNNLDPHGGNTATKLIESATTGNHVITQGLSGLLNNTVYGLSTYAKAAEDDWLALQITKKDGTGGTAYFDLANGEVGTIDGAKGARIVPALHGFYRCSIWANVATGPAQPTAWIYLAAADFEATYAGVLNNGAYIWGSQFELGTEVNTYVPTAAAAVSALTPVRFVNDPSDLAATLEADAPMDAGEAVIFYKGAFSFTPPESASPGMPSVGIECINVGGDLARRLEAAISYAAPVEVTYRQYLSSDLTQPQFVLDGLTLKTVRAGVFRVVASAGFEDMLNKRSPKRLYTAREFPGLVR